MNLEDVARRAGVSTATVSRVLNDLGVVRKSTRTKVLRAVDELKYSPNLHARALAGASRTIGLIVSNLENPFFLDIFHSLEAGARELGYEVLIANTSYDPALLKSSIQMMLGRRPLGLAVVVSEIEPHMLDALSERGIRSVVYDATTLRPGITNIRTNYRRGMQRITEYLHSLGHRRMAFIGHHTALGPLHDRREAFIEGLKTLQPAVEYRIAMNDDSFAGGRQAVREIFESGFRPSAIVCVNDVMAIGVLRQLKDQGLSVPGDVSVSGFDNINLAEVVSPSLTTAHIPRDRIGREILKALVTTPGTPGAHHSRGSSELVIEPELVLRESTGPAAPDKS